jgi:hypothetical protein
MSDFKKTLGLSIDKRVGFVEFNGYEFGKVGLFLKNVGAWV